MLTLTIATVATTAAAIDMATVRAREDSAKAGLEHTIQREETYLRRHPVGL